jgi:hypothetical protein
MSATNMHVHFSARLFHEMRRFTSLMAQHCGDARCKTCANWDVLPFLALAEPFYSL